jgi:hypothetical protein
MTLTVRDQGEPLSPTTDYTIEGDNIIELVAEASEPLTVGDEKTQVVDASLPAVLGVGVLEERGGFASTDYDLTRLRAVYSNTLGISTRRRPLREVVGEIVAGGLGFLTTSTAGKIVADCLVPPTSPSPRDGACLEIVATEGSPADSGVRWSDTGVGTVSGSDFTVCAWVKTHHLGPPSTTALDVASHRVPIMEMGSGGPSLFCLSTLYGVGRLQFVGLGGSELQAVAFADWLAGEDERWMFVALANDSGAGAANWYGARKGEALRLLGSTATLGLSGLGFGGVLVGSSATESTSFRGSVFEPQVWDAVLTLSELQDLMDAPPVGNEVGLTFFAPLDGDDGASITDTVSSDVGVVAGDVREVPDLALDLTSDPKQITFRQLRPAHDIRVEYRRNFRPLGPAEIAATVSQEDALDLQTEARWERWQNPEIKADYLDARDVTIPALWADEAGARATLRHARHRFAPGREVATLAGVDRRALLLSLGDEVRVYGQRWGLDGGPTFRVASIKANFANLTADLGLWR